MQHKKIFYTLSLIICLLGIQSPLWAQDTDPKETELKQKVTANPNDVEAVVALAEYYYNAYLDKEALDTWQKALVLKPKDMGNVYYKMSQSYRYLKDWPKALETAQKAVGIKPQSDQYMNGYGVIYYESGDANKALEQYKKAVLLKGDYNIYHYNIGKAYFDLKNDVEAKKAFEKSISLKADDALSYYYLGLIAHESKNYEQAIAYFKSSLAHDPKSYDAHYEQGISYYYLKDYENAEAAFRKALEINTDPSKRLHYWIGASLVFQKDPAKNTQGIEYLKQQIVFDPTDVGAQSVLGFAYWRDGKFGDAVNQYLKVMKDKYSDPDTNYYLGSSYLGTDSYQLAIDYLKKAVELDKEFYAAYTELGYAYAKAKRYTEAMAAYNLALKVAPAEMITFAERFNPPDVVHHRIALVHFDEKRYADCITSVDKAIALYAEDHNFYITKGACYYQNGKYPEALEQYKKAIAMKGDDEIVHYNLGLVYWKLNDGASAQKHYDFLVQSNSTYAAKLKDQMGGGTTQSFWRNVDFWILKARFKAALFFWYGTKCLC